MGRQVINDLDMLGIKEPKNSKFTSFDSALLKRQLFKSLQSNLKVLQVSIQVPYVPEISVHMGDHCTCGSESESSIKLSKILFTSALSQLILLQPPRRMLSVFQG